MLRVRAVTLEDTRAIAASIARVARQGDLIVLAGEMGAGKTAFAQGFAKELGVHEPVTSPTYTIVHSYQIGSSALHHADLYRLEHTAEIADLAFEELLEQGIVLVEWGDVVDLGPQLRIEIAVGEDDDTRELVVTSSDRRWAARWERLEALLEQWEMA